MNLVDCAFERLQSAKLVYYSCTYFVCPKLHEREYTFFGIQEGGRRISAPIVPHRSRITQAANIGRFYLFRENKNFANGTTNYRV